MSKINIFCEKSSYAWRKMRKRKENLCLQKRYSRWQASKNVYEYNKHFSQLCVCCRGYNCLALIRREWRECLCLKMWVRKKKNLVTRTHGQTFKNISLGLLPQIKNSQLLILAYDGKIDVWNDFLLRTEFDCILSQQNSHQISTVTAKPRKKSYSFRSQLIYELNWL